MLCAQASLGADDPEEPDAGVSVIGTALGEQELGALPQHELVPPTVRELALQEVVVVRGLLSDSDMGAAPL